MKSFLFPLMICLAGPSFAQELFVYSDPASNIPAKALSVRLTNNIMRMEKSEKYRFASSPEVMIGISKNLMLKADAVFSNMQGDFKMNTAGFYAKYRFFSNDEVHNHLRMAAFVRGSVSSLHVHQPAIDLDMMNSGFETGLIFTKLVKRTAVSASVSHLYAADNSNGNKFEYGSNQRHALNYTLSFGRLMLPKEYSSYDQTNVNLMLEIPVQTNLGTGNTFVDLAPSLQFIIRSRVRVDLGYRFAVLNDLARTSEGGALVRLEYNFFNAF